MVVTWRTVPGQAASTARHAGATAWSRVTRHQAADRPDRAERNGYDDRILFELRRAYPIEHVPDVALRTLIGALGYRELLREHDALAALRPDVPFVQRVLDEGDLRVNVATADLRRVPDSGGLLVYANHATGVLDAIVLAALIGRVRPDVRILANEVGLQFPAFGEMTFPVAVLRDDPHVSSNGVRRAIAWLGDGGALIVFPAGEMSLYSLRERRVKDRPWRPAVVRIAELADRASPGVRLLPAHIRGRNSPGFYAAGVLHPSIAVALMPREVLRSRHRAVRVDFGTPFAAAELGRLPDADTRLAELRRRSEALAPA